MKNSMLKILLALSQFSTNIVEQVKWDLTCWITSIAAVYKPVKNSLIKNDYSKFSKIFQNNFEMIKMNFTIQCKIKMSNPSRMWWLLKFTMGTNYVLTRIEKQVMQELINAKTSLI